jgi:CRP-like cAMP-binding protein
MKQLLAYLSTRLHLTTKDKELVQKHFTYEQQPANTALLKIGQVERYVYFLEKGIIRGYQNKNGKIIVGHLVSKSNFFGSLDSFMTETPSLDCFEAITDIEYCKITKPDFELLKSYDLQWGNFVESVINENLTCKMDRIKDFQILTAKERYLKFLKESPNLALQVSVENMASYLGIEAPSLSRIRKQIMIKQ